MTETGKESLHTRLAINQHWQWAVWASRPNHEVQTATVVHAGIRAFALQPLLDAVTVFMLGWHHRESTNEHSSGFNRTSKKWGEHGATRPPNRPSEWALALHSSGSRSRVLIMTFNKDTAVAFCLKLNMVYGWSGAGHCGNNKMAALSSDPLILDVAGLTC